jgi:hypothetical protein
MMELILAAASTGNPLRIFLSPSLIVILLFVGVFAGLNILEKGRWD